MRTVLDSYQHNLPGVSAELCGFLEAVSDEDTAVPVTLAQEAPTSAMALKLLGVSKKQVILVVLAFFQCGNNFCDER